MDLTIRPADEPDLPAILRLYAQPEMDDGRVLSNEAAAVVLRRIATYPQYALYVAAHQGAVVGTFALLIMDNLAHGGAPSAIVEDVCVDEACRRQGIGRAMMEFAVTFARARGCYKLALSSNLGRAHAHAFYRSLGFEQHGVSFSICLSP